MPPIRPIHQNGLIAREATERAISKEPYKINTRPRTDANAKNVLTGRMSAPSPPSRKMTDMTMCHTFQPPGRNTARAASLTPAPMRTIPRSTPTVAIEV